MDWRLIYCTCSYPAMQRQNVRLPLYTSRPRLISLSTCKSIVIVFGGLCKKEAGQIRDE